MNWGSWLSGAIVALATGGLTVVTTLATLKECPAGYQLFVIAAVPTISSFLAYIKQSPPPIGANVPK